MPGAVAPGESVQLPLVIREAAVGETCAYYLPLAGIVASLVVFLLTVKIDENMHAHIVEQLEGRLASEEADKQ